MKNVLSTLVSAFMVPVLAFTAVSAAGMGQTEGGDIYRVKNVTKNIDFTDPVAATCGDTVQFKVRIHNPGPSAMQNVSVIATLPSGTATTHTSTATVSSPYADPSSTSDTATVNLDKAGKLSYVTGSTELLDAHLRPGDADGKVQLTHYSNPSPWSLTSARKCKAISVSISWTKERINRTVNQNKRLVNNRYCVRLVKGSTWANSGKHGQREVPFKATVRGDFSLMVYNSRLRVWEHWGEIVNGRFKQVCRNKWKIGVKPTLTDNDVVMVETEAEVEYKLELELSAAAAVMVRGSLACPTGTLYGEASASSVARTEVTIYVKASSEAEARAKGASAAAHVEALAKLSVKVKAEVEASAHVKIHLECTSTPPANKPPTGEIVQFPEHLFTGGWYRAKVVGSDPEDGGNVTLTYTVTGGASIKTDANHPTICDVEGSQKVCTFWIQAGDTSGVNATLKLTVKDTDGETSPPYTKTWPIVADEF